MKKNTTFKLNNLEELQAFYNDHKLDFFTQDFETIKDLFLEGNNYAIDKFGNIALTTEYFTKNHIIVDNPYAQMNIDKIEVEHDEIETNEKYKDIKNLLIMVGLTIPNDYVIESIIDASKIEVFNTDNILRFFQKHK